MLTLTLCAALGGCDRAVLRQATLGQCQVSAEARYRPGLNTNLALKRDCVARTVAQCMTANGFDFPSSSGPSEWSCLSIVPPISGLIDPSAR